MGNDRDLDPDQLFIHSDDLAYLVEMARQRGVVDDAVTTERGIWIRIGSLGDWMHPVEARTFLRRVLYLSDRHYGA